mmetsp:Transcript_12834/g.35009  ORF Transcript_12834/g.35009 Transcript_12834/m.35009 type:complete len:86 (+) Transcript_12834:3721-3978(+)
MDELRLNHRREELLQGSMRSSQQLARNQSWALDVTEEKRASSFSPLVEGVFFYFPPSHPIFGIFKAPKEVKSCQNCMFLDLLSQV